MPSNMVANTNHTYYFVEKSKCHKISPLNGSIGHVTSQRKWPITGIGSVDQHNYMLRDDTKHSCVSDYRHIS